MVRHSPCQQVYHSVEMDTYNNASKVKIQHQNNVNKIILEQNTQALDGLHRVGRCSLAEQVKGISCRGKNMDNITFQESVNSLIRLDQSVIQGLVTICV